MSNSKRKESAPKALLEISIQSASGKRLTRSSSVAELKEAIQQFMPEIEPYAAQAAAHLVVTERAAIDAGRWQIQIVGEYVFQAVKVIQKQRSKARAVAAPTKEAATAPARDPVQSQPSPAPLFPPEKLEEDPNV